MNLGLKISGVILLGTGLVFPVLSSAQSRQARSNPAAVVKEQQKAGENLYLQNCSFCHSPRKEGNPKSTGEGSTIGPPLQGLMHGSKPVSQAVVRTFILRGSTDKMPGFQYALAPKEIDSIIAYLKTL